MAMTYTSLTAAKGTAGSIANWVSYTKLDITTIVDEAQALIYSLLRCREMMTSFMFSLGIGDSYVPLPARFLDPIGRMQFTSFAMPVIHKDGNFVQQCQSFTELSGTLDTDPFTTVADSDVVTVSLPGHGFSQGSVFNTSGAIAFNGATIAGTFPITSITTDTFTIDIASLGTTPNASGAGGGDVVDYTCDNLVQGVPQVWGIWDERIQFEVAMAQQLQGRLQYFQSLPLLSSTNPSNFLTNRYPQLVRVACVAAAADFMKDDSEYQKGMARLQGLIDRIGIENDGSMRGMELDTVTP